MNFPGQRREVFCEDQNSNPLLISGEKPQQTPPTKEGKEEKDEEEEEEQQVSENSEEEDYHPVFLSSD